MCAESDYWEECIAQAAEECGLELTQEQLKYLAGSAECGHDNYSMAFGCDVADKNYISDEARELEQLKVSLEKKRRRELETDPCSTCTTTGSVRDGWGRNVNCPDCRGEGRH